MSPSKSKVFIVAYRVLIVSIILLAILYYYQQISSWPDWVGGISLNLISEMTGIIITVALIEHVISKRDERQQQERIRISIARLSKPLQDHFSLLTRMYKAASLAIPQTIGGPICSVFDDDFLSTLPYLDFFSESPTIQKQPWVVYTSNMCKEFKNSIESILYAYGFFIDDDMASNLEEICNSDFINMLIEARTLPSIFTQQQMQPVWNLLAPGDMVAAKRHIELCCMLLDKCKKYISGKALADQVEKIWAADMAPSIGSGRSAEPRWNDRPFRFNRQAG